MAIGQTAYPSEHPNAHQNRLSNQSEREITLKNKSHSPTHTRTHTRTHKHIFEPTAFEFSTKMAKVYVSLKPGCVKKGCALVLACLELGESGLGCCRPPCKKFDFLGVWWKPLLDFNQKVQV